MGAGSPPVPLPAKVPAIECHHLRTPYASALKRSILDGVNCTIQQGEFITLLGLNGAGKSSLLRALVGLLPVQEGEMRIQGTLVTPRTLGQVRRNISMLFQGGGLVPQLSALDNVLCGRLSHLSTWKTLWGFSNRDRKLALDLLARLGLQDQVDQKTSQLSGGQRQRVAIARALIQAPQILLVDEPVTGLDVIATQQVMDILSELHQEQGMTIVAVLHDLALAQAYSQRSIVLDAGQVVYDGSSDQIQAQFAEMQP